MRQGEEGHSQAGGGARLVYRLSVTLADERGNVLREMHREAPARDAALRWWPSDVADFTHGNLADTLTSDSERTEPTPETQRNPR